MKKLIALLLVCALALAGYVAAGPFLTMRTIRDAIQRQDTRTISEQVDFDRVRASVKAQLEDYVARQMSDPSPDNPVRQLTSQVTGALTEGVVEVLVTPAGIGAIMQGRSVIRRAMGFPPERTGGAPDTSFDPLKNATYGYESPSRFVATVPNADGVPIRFIFTRDGLRWRITDIRLPVDQLVGSFRQSLPGR